ncbi:MAG: hypothetical protein R3C14_14980 [Caldilineaceae bacterium]
MTQPQWPDPLQPPDPARVAWLLAEFWRLLARLPDLLNRHEHLLAEALTTAVRNVVLEMMLALNGIQWPAQTRHLNTYLSASQRAAIEKTLTLSSVNGDQWLGRAVALTVIYHWYAPQLVGKWQLVYPQTLEDATQTRLQRELPDWPLTITTDPADNTANSTPATASPQQSADAQAAADQGKP